MRIGVRSSRLLLFVAALALLVALLAACGGDEAESADPAAEPPAEAGPAEGEPVRLAAFLLAFANSYAQEDKTGVERAASELGAEVEYFDGEFDGSIQLTQLEDAIASGNFDGFVLFANDGTVVQPAVEDAIAAGIKVVAVYTPIGPDINSLEAQVPGLVATVANPIEGDGIGMGEAAVDACADIDPCKVIYVSGGFSIPFEVSKFDAFKRVIAESPNIELVGQGEAGFLREEGYTVAQDLLQANPDVNVYVTSGDQMTFGAEQAMVDAGIPEGQIALVGNGASCEAVEAVGEGRWHSSFVYMPQTEGYLGTKLAIEAVRGEAPDYTAIEMIQESPIGEFVTQENAGEFECEWKIG
jgi:ribose transport system substrate-binding protein